MIPSTNTFESPYEISITLAKLPRHWRGLKYQKYTLWDTQKPQNTLSPNGILTVGTFHQSPLHWGCRIDPLGENSEYGRARVSTGKQNIDRQIVAQIRFDVSEPNIIIDKASLTSLSLKQL